MAKHIIIDLGTANTKIFDVGNADKGLIFSSPSVVAADKETGRVIAVGTDAKNLMGREPAKISVITPIKSGVISDFEAATAMLKIFLTSAVPRGTLRPRADIIIPVGATDMEQRTLKEAAERSGVKVQKITQSPMAAAASANLETDAPFGNMILDIGAGLVTAAVVSFGGVVCAATSHFAGNEMDKSIKEYIKKNFNVTIGIKTAEEIKCAVGAAHPAIPSKEICVLGRDNTSGLPKEITVTSDEVRSAIAPVLSGICDTVRSALENTPAELTCDLSERGITLCGGGASLPGLSQFLQENIGLSAGVSS